MAKTLYDTFCAYHPEFSEELNTFSKPVKDQIIRKLRNTNDQNNFRSLVSEVSFGELFQELGFEVEYEKKYSIAKSVKENRPDWTIKVGCLKAICEVYRLGKSYDDQQHNDFENQLMEKIEELPYSYYLNLKIRYSKESFDTSEENITSIITQIKEWMSASKKKVGDKFTIPPFFEFEIIKTETDYETVCCCINTNIINIKPEKVEQAPNLRPNEITKKLNHYNKIIESEKLSYFLCVSIDFSSGLQHRNFVEYFLGKGVEFADYGTDIGNLNQFRHLGKQWTKLGEFYNNPMLSGIITLYGGEFRLLLNPVKSQVIYREEYSEFRERLSILQKADITETEPIH